MLQHAAVGSAHRRAGQAGAGQAREAAARRGARRRRLPQVDLLHGVVPCRLPTRVLLRQPRRRRESAVPHGLPIRVLLRQPRRRRKRAVPRGLHSWVLHRRPRHRRSGRPGRCARRHRRCHSNARRGCATGCGRAHADALCLRDGGQVRGGRGGRSAAPGAVWQRAARRHGRRVCAAQAAAQAGAHHSEAAGRGQRRGRASLAEQGSFPELKRGRLHGQQY